MTTMVQDQILSTGGPFIRLVQPEEPNSPYPDSSYIRLGSYVTRNQEEALLTTGLTRTRSTISAGIAVSGPSAGQVTTSNIGAVFSAASQLSKDHQTVPGPPIASTNDGILIYTDHDLNETIKGAALQKFGQGHVVRVETGDAAYAVQRGMYDLYAQNGVFVYAGSKAQPANIEMVSEAHLKLTAFGDFETKISGNANKKTVGTTFEHFVGAKCSLLLGAEANIKLGGTLNIFGGLDTQLRHAGKLSVIFGFDASFNTSMILNMLLGYKFSATFGGEVKYIKGLSSKIVRGEDIKQTLGDLKIVNGGDFKLVDLTDAKRVNINMTICDIDLKKEFASVKDSKFATTKTDLTSKLDKLCVDKSSIDITQSDLKMFL